MSDNFYWEQLLMDLEPSVTQNLASFDPLEVEENPLQVGQEFDVGFNEFNTGFAPNVPANSALLPFQQQASVSSNNAVNVSLFNYEPQAMAGDTQPFNPQMIHEDWQMFNDIADLSDFQPDQSFQQANNSFGDFSESLEFTAQTPVSILDGPIEGLQTKRRSSISSSMKQDTIQLEVLVPPANSTMPQLSDEDTPVAKLSGTDGKPKATGGRRDARINVTTQGGTSRTNKINNYQPIENYPEIYPHPFNSLWYTANHKAFAYTQYNELEETTFSFTRLYEFIRQHPSRNPKKANGAKLTLYIQKGPADSTRRYPTTQSDKCRFADCPSRKYGFHGTIAVGHFRIALDEMSHTHGEATDPFLCAGYVHLYCLERFMNFPEICRMANIQVQADDRTLRKEPRATFRARIDGNAYVIAANFIDSCRDGSLDESFPEYPSHVVTKNAAGKRFVKTKDHAKMLNYALQKATMPDRSKTAKNAAKPGTLAATFGDLEVQLGARRRHYATSKKARKSRKRARDESDGDDDNEEEEEEGSDGNEWQPSGRKKAKR